MSKKHGLIMIACCLIALGAAAAVLFFKVPINNMFIILMFLLCPLSHLMMMGMMKKNGHEHLQSTDNSSVSLPKSQEKV
jgi:hypothetical protein